MDPLAQGAGVPRRPMFGKKKPQMTGQIKPRQKGLPPHPDSFFTVGPPIPQQIKALRNKLFSTGLPLPYPVQHSGQNHTQPHPRLERRCAHLPQSTSQLNPEGQSNSSGTFSPNLVPIPCPLVPTRAKRDLNPSGVNHCGREREELSTGILITCFSFCYGSVQENV